MANPDIVPDKSVDCVIADLPYAQTSLKWDEEIDSVRLFEIFSRITKPETAILLFGQEPFASALRLSSKDYKYDLYWEKEELTNIMQVKRRPGKVVETISVFYEKQCVYTPQMVLHHGKPVVNKVKNGRVGKLVDSGSKNCYSYQDSGWRYPTQVLRIKSEKLSGKLLHPTQKPLELVKWLAATYSKPGGTVLDCCMGSGTTGAACLELGREFIGIEKDPAIFEAARNRLESYEIEQESIPSLSEGFR
jgi:site-specific DNA-methyltransferase (adenine-specific)